MICYPCRFCGAAMESPQSIVGQMEQCYACGKMQVVPAGDIPSSPAPAPPAPIVAEGGTHAPKASRWVKEYTHVDLYSPSATIVVAVVGLITALLVGLMFSVPLEKDGPYIIILFPVIAAFLIVAVVRPVMRITRFHHGPLGGGLGAILGLMCYISQYCFAYSRGGSRAIETSGRIAWRGQSQLSFSYGPTLFWIIAIIEGIVLTAIVAAKMSTAATNPITCPCCGGRLKKTWRVVRGMFGSQVLEALRVADLGTVVGKLMVGKSFKERGASRKKLLYTVLQLHYCPGSACAQRADTFGFVLARSYRAQGSPAPDEQPELERVEVSDQIIRELRKRGKPFSSLEVFWMSWFLKS